MTTIQTTPETGDKGIENQKANPLANLLSRFGIGARKPLAPDTDAETSDEVAFSDEWLEEFNSTAGNMIEDIRDFESSDLHAQRLRRFTQQMDNREGACAQTCAECIITICELGADCCQVPAPTSIELDEPYLTFQKRHQAVLGQHREVCKLYGNQNPCVGIIGRAMEAFDALPKTQFLKAGAGNAQEDNAITGTIADHNQYVWRKSLREVHLTSEQEEMDISDPS